MCKELKFTGLWCAVCREWTRVPYKNDGVYENELPCGCDLSCVILYNYQCACGVPFSSKWGWLQASS